MAIETGTIRVLGPLKPIACTWDMSADLNEPQAAGCYAKFLLPISQDQDGFFVHAARELLREILVVLIRSRKRWGLRELIDITSDVQLLRKAERVYCGEETRERLEDVVELMNFAFEQGRQVLTAELRAASRLGTSEGLPEHAIKVNRPLSEESARHTFIALSGYKPNCCHRLGDFVAEACILPDPTFLAYSTEIVGGFNSRHWHNAHPHSRCP